MYRGSSQSREVSATSLLPQSQTTYQKSNSPSTGFAMPKTSPAATPAAVIFRGIITILLHLAIVSSVANALACFGMVFDTLYYHYAILVSVCLNVAVGLASTLNPKSRGLRAIMWTIMTALWVITTLWQCVVLSSLSYIWATCRYTTMCDPGLLCAGGSSCTGLTNAERYEDIGLPSVRFLAVFSLTAIVAIVDLLCTITSVILCVVAWRFAS